MTVSTYGELTERAKFLRSRMHEVCFTKEEREFIRASILHGEILAVEKERLRDAAIYTGVSHEFELVLSSIQKQSSLLASQAPEGHLGQSANEIVQTVERGGRFVSFLQSIGKGPPIDLGKPFNINDLLLKMKGTLSAIIGENEKLVFELCRHSLRVACVSSMLEQVLMNLVANARDAIPHKGMITVATTAVSITNEYLADHPDAWVGSFVCISVSDKGCGISAKDLPHIFEPFFSSKKKKGVGLGLYISREIVRKNGGWIEVKTRLGRGSTFSVFLPEVDPPK
jgi:two-component system, cell cycle sensor histidine kinase and response regulator CckA